MLLCLLYGGVAPGLAQIYRWTDNAGRVHFTDNPGTIPPERREHSRQLAPDTTRSGAATDVPSRSLPPGVPTATTDGPQPAASESVSRLQEQARTLEEQIAVATQERDQLLEQLKAVRPLRMHLGKDPQDPATWTSMRARRQVDEQGRSLAAVEKRLDALRTELQQVQAKLQEAGQDQRPVPAGKDQQSTVMLDNQGRDQTYWRRRLEALQAQLRQAQEQRQVILGQLGSDVKERQGFGRRGVEVLQLTRDLERLEQDMRATETALQALQQDAARAGVPAEWLQ